MVAPTDMPRKMVTIFISAFWAVSESRLTTRDSRMKLPNMNMPISGATAGISRQISDASRSEGKRSFSRADTGRSWRMRIRRCAGVVIKRMMGGWISGTMAM